MHLGIIMDGNGRWATAQQLPRLRGHARGVEVVREVVRSCPKLGVDTITLFAFAIANWKRDKEEVDGLWSLFHTFIRTDIAELIAEGVRVRVIGNRDGLPENIRKEIIEAEGRSAGNTAFLLQIALNYDGVEEVARLLKNAIEAGVAASAVDEAYVKDHLDTEAHNEPDIIIRTGMPAPKEGMAVWRSSAFLPIQGAQSVCVSTEVLWPDFTPVHLREIIAYADPDARLFGGQRIDSATSSATA